MSMTNRTFNNRFPLNLSGMSKDERRAYQTWISAEEENIRRVKYGRVTAESAKYHDKLNRLCNTICGK